MADHDECKSKKAITTNQEKMQNQSLKFEHRDTSWDNSQNVNDTQKRYDTLDKIFLSTKMNKTVDNLLGKYHYQV